MKRTEYFVSLQTSVVLTQEHNVMVKNEKLIGSSEYVTIYAECRINRCRHNRVRQYLSYNENMKIIKYCCRIVIKVFKTI